MIGELGKTPQVYEWREIVRGYKGMNAPQARLIMQAPVFLIDVRSYGAKLAFHDPRAAIPDDFHLPLSPLVVEIVLSDDLVLALWVFETKKPMRSLRFGGCVRQGEQWREYTVFFVVDREKFEFGVFDDHNNQVDSEPYGSMIFGIYILVWALQRAETPARSWMSAKARRQITARPDKYGWEYRIVELPSASVEKGPHQGGTHASPRWHLRRGHWRTIKATGKSYWVDGHEVGSKDRGGVVHDYRVETEEAAKHGQEAACGRRRAMAEHPRVPDRPRAVGAPDGPPSRPSAVSGVGR